MTSRRTPDLGAMTRLANLATVTLVRLGEIERAAPRIGHDYAGRIASHAQVSQARVKLLLKILRDEYDVESNVLAYAATLSPFIGRAWTLAQHLTVALWLAQAANADLYLQVINSVPKASRLARIMNDGGHSFDGWLRRGPLRGDLDSVYIGTHCPRGTNPDYPFIYYCNPNDIVAFAARQGLPASRGRDWSS